MRGRRRAFLRIAAGTFIALPAVVCARQSGRPVPVGLMPLGSSSSPYDQSLVDAFRQGLREAGVVGQRDVVLDVVWIGSAPDTYQAVDDLIDRGVRMLISCGSSGSGAAAESGSLGHGDEWRGAGGLITYRASVPLMYRRAATYGDKILKGVLARRPARRAADEARAGHQPQDCQGPRPDDSAVAAHAGRPGHSVIGASSLPSVACGRLLAAPFVATIKSCAPHHQPVPLQGPPQVLQGNERGRNLQGCSFLHLPNFFYPAIPLRKTSGARLVSTRAESTAARAGRPPPGSV